MNSIKLVTCMLTAAMAAGTGSQAAAATKAMTSSALTPESVNDAGLASVVASRSKGAAVLRAQILLDRAHFSPGEIDAAFGSNMQRAIAGYQASKAIAVTGTVDAATWAALNSDSAPALANYTITAEDVAGPYVAIPDDMMEKSKLPALGYRNSLEALGEKFHASPSLLQQLNPGKDFNRAGEQVVAPNVEGAAPMPAISKVVVDKSNFTVALVDAAGKTVAQFPASSGSEHDPLPIGDWKVQGIAKNPVFHYNPDLFWDANPEHAKAKIPAGPNNPVGVVWVDLSKEHYGIHGTPEPSKIGKTQSHGCIRMTNWSAMAMALAAAPGMAVVLQE